MMLIIMFHLFVFLFAVVFVIFVFLFLIQFNDKIEQVIINEILYNDLRNGVEKLKKEKQELQKQSIEERINKIKQNKERLKLE